MSHPDGACWMPDGEEPKFDRDTYVRFPALDTDPTGSRLVGGAEQPLTCVDGQGECLGSPTGGLCAFECQRQSKREPASSDALDCIADAYGDYCEAVPDADQLPPPWVETAQVLLGDERANAIHDARVIQAVWEAKEMRERAATKGGEG